MIKKLILSTFVISLCMVCYSTYIYTHSAGAPAYATGAPNEATCAQANCHVGNNVITNDAAVQIKLMEDGKSITSYSPGKNYDVVVSVDAVAAAFGFEATVKDEAKKYVGKLSLGSDNSVKIVGVSGLHVTHSNASPTKKDYDEWHFKWTAPDKNVGNIHIYTAVNAANGNGNSLGDQIYTNSLMLTAEPTNISDQKLFSENYKSYLDASSNILHTEFVLQEASVVDLKVYDLSGKCVLDTQRRFSKGYQILNLETHSLKQGIYFIKVSAGINLAVSKIYKL